MTKTGLICALLLLVTLGCKKDKKEDASTCALAMKEKFKTELICKPNNNTFWEVKLFKGDYKGKVVYFPLVVCPNCYVAAPSYGYTCADEKVNFENFADVKNRKAIYNGCTDKFLD